MNLQNTYADIVEIGSGGGGTVFRAYHVRMKKYVVLKKIHSSIQNSIDIRGELDILKNLRHSYLPTVLDFIEDDGSIYTVMDYVAGESFENLLSKGAHFNQSQVIKYAGQIGEVITYLHGQTPPIVHGDIKPANIMLTPEDNICLIDFNISHAKNGNVTFNMGYTPGYAAPEQIEALEELKRYILQGIQSDAANIEGTVILDVSDKTVLPDTADKTVLLEEDDTGTELLQPDEAFPALQPSEQAVKIMDRMDERSDIYSVGATLYTLLLGKPPATDSEQAVLYAVKKTGASEGLAQLICKCMCHAPERRFQSAQDFLKAVTGIAKVDKRYKRLVRKQEAMLFFCMIGFAGCVLLTVLGREKMAAEKVALYNNLLSEMAELQMQGEEGELDKIYQEALKVFPDYAGAYYQKALYLYYHRQYQEMITLITQDALKNGRQFSEEENGDFYYLLANGYLESGEPERAIGCYQTAIQYNPYSSFYYVDYAIALARADKVDEAANALTQAMELGISDDKILLAQGEMKGRQKLNAEAADCFRQCITETDDEYVRFRAYVMWGKLYDNTDVDALMQKAAVLEEGVVAVHTNYRAAVLEQLTQTYIDLGDLTGNGAYYMQAIQELQEIIELGWDTYVTHNNIGILYEKVGEYESAEQKFKEMLLSYGEDYRIYKRLAFLELDMQAAKENGDREYSLFQEYFNTANELFAQSGQREDSDMEMQLLKQAYEQLREGNWF